MHVIAIQETWLGRGDRPRAIPGYIWELKSRKAYVASSRDKGGGLAFLVHDDIAASNARIIHNSDTPGLQSTFVLQVDVPNDQQVHIVNTYTDQKKYLDDAKLTADEIWTARADLLLQIQGSNPTENIFFVGDMNAHTGSLPTHPGCFPHTGYKTPTEMAVAFFNCSTEQAWL